MQVVIRIMVIQIVEQVQEVVLQVDVDDQVVIQVEQVVIDSRPPMMRKV